MFSNSKAWATFWHQHILQSLHTLFKERLQKRSLENLPRCNKCNFLTFLTFASQTTRLITVCRSYSLQLRISSGIAVVRQSKSDVTYAVDLASRIGGKATSLPVVIWSLVQQRQKFTNWTCGLLMIEDDVLNCHLFYRNTKVMPAGSSGSAILRCSLWRLLQPPEYHELCCLIRVKNVSS